MTGDDLVCRYRSFRYASTFIVYYLSKLIGWKGFINVAWLLTWNMLLNEQIQLAIYNQLSARLPNYWLDSCLDKQYEKLNMLCRF